jgi:hypothetical protein
MLPTVAEILGLRENVLMNPQPLNLTSALATFEDVYSPRIVAS